MKYNHNSRLSIRKAPMVYSSCYTPHWQQWWSLPRHVACCRVAAAGNCCLLHPSPGVQTSASKSSIRRFVITEKAPTRALSWLKAATTAFTFKTLLRHYAEQALTPRSLNVKLGPRRKGHKGQVAGGLVSIVSYSHPSLMIIALWTQFHVYLPWGKCPFSIVS